MDDIENDSLVDIEYDRLNAKASIIYKFVMTYSDYIKTARDYGSGEIINMVEVHTLTAIEGNPGITITEAALKWNRTKGAVSQIVAKLENRGLIVRKREDGNAKNAHLYVTDRGKTLSKAHRAYDVKELILADKMLHEDFTTKEIDAFYKVMRQYTTLLDKPYI